MLTQTQRIAPFSRGGKFQIDAALFDEQQAQIAIPKGASVQCTLRTDNGHTVQHLDFKDISDKDNVGLFSLFCDKTDGFPTGVFLYAVVIFEVEAQYFASATLIIPIVK